MIKRAIITLALTSAMLFSVSNIAKANECSDNTEDWLMSDKMAAISIIEKTGHITIYVDNYNPTTKGLRNIGFHGWDQSLSDSLVAKGCVSPVFIPLYTNEGKATYIPGTVDATQIEFMYRHK